MSDGVIVLLAMFGCWLVGTVIGHIFGRRRDHATVRADADDEQERKVN